MVRLWIVHGMAHQWSAAVDGGSPEDAAITDPDGPNLTPRILDFLLHHQQRDR